MGSQRVRHDLATEQQHEAPGISQAQCWALGFSAQLIFSMEETTACSLGSQPRQNVSTTWGIKWNQYPAAPPTAN